MQLEGNLIYACALNTHLQSVQDASCMLLQEIVGTQPDLHQNQIFCRGLEIKLNTMRRLSAETS